MNRLALAIHTLVRDYSVDPHIPLENLEKEAILVITVSVQTPDGALEGPLQEMDPINWLYPPYRTIDRPAI